MNWGDSKIWGDNKDHRVATRRRRKVAATMELSPDDSELLEKAVWYGCKAEQMLFARYLYLTGSIKG